MRTVLLATWLLANLLIPQNATPVSRLTRIQAVRHAATWLHTVQRDNGGFGGCDTTADGIRMIAQAGQNPNSSAWVKNGNTPVQSLIIQRCPLPDDSGVVAKTVLALAAAGINPRTFNSTDLVARLQSAYDPAAHTYHPYSNFRLALVIEALAAAHAPIEPAAIQFLRDQQRITVHDQASVGGWDWPYDTRADATSAVDTTGEVLMALAAAGVPGTDPVFSRADAYLRRAQKTDAAWPACANSPPDCDNPSSNANSTALAVAGLVAAYRNPFSSAYVQSNRNPVAALLAFQESSGAFVYESSAPESRLLATLDVVNALAPVYPGDRFLPLIALRMP